jgi:hypothetical protein
VKKNWAFTLLVVLHFAVGFCLPSFLPVIHSCDFAFGLVTLQLDFRGPGVWWSRFSQHVFFFFPSGFSFCLILRKKKETVLDGGASCCLLLFWLSKIRWESRFSS